MKNLQIKQLLFALLLLLPGLAMTQIPNAGFENWTIAGQDTSADQWMSDNIGHGRTTDAHSGDVLMVAYMNEESLRKTLEIREAVYYSRSRQVIWHKGATSGEFQKVIEIRIDCDQDCIVLKVEQQGGGCCHVGHPSCFYRKVDLDSLAEGSRVPLSKA